MPNQPNASPFISTQRASEMKFGTQITASGTRFRLWAPRTESVDLLLGETTMAVPMLQQVRGWFQYHANGVEPGTLYSFRLADGTEVPDPASRFQPQGVLGPSEVVDPRRFAWSDVGWVGQPWEQAVIYELHVGTFTPEGTFRAAAEKLDYLVALGVTAIELMPVNAFPGRWNWGYDGVLPFAPDASYGRPEDLKALVDAAHARGLMMLLDVVYNHFGPKGNYMPQYAPMLTGEHETPWGAAMNFDGPGSEMVRDFILANARYWLTEYHFDGLRLDAVHEIKDDGFNHLLHDLALQIRSSTDGRHSHLIVENEENNPNWLGRTNDLRAGLYDAQWNDDIHHLIDVKLYGERSNYRADYLERGDWLPRALATGFGYQGEGVPTRHGAPKGGPSADLPPAAFISFIQNHDQIGNRLFGERIGELADPAKARVAAAIYLLSPQIPLLFMGEEWGSTTPFLFFSDVDPMFAADIRKSRIENFGPFLSPAKADLPVPDAMAESSFTGSKLNWGDTEQDDHAQWLTFYRELIAVRRSKIVPLLSGVAPRSGAFELLNGGAFLVRWKLAGGNVLTLLANLGDSAVSGIALPGGRRLWHEGQVTETTLGPWSAYWALDDGKPA